METKKPSNASTNHDAKENKNSVNAECLSVTKNYQDDYFAYCRNSKNSGISKILNDRTNQLKNPEITTRQINSWDSYGLVDVSRDGREWRKYSIMDAVWLNTIAELRNFAVSIEIIKKVKASLETSNDIVGTPMPVLEFCVYKAILHKQRMVLLVFSDGSAFPLSYEQYLINVHLGTIKNHVMLDLSELLQRNFEANKKTLINNIEGEDLSDEEMKLLKFIRNGRYDKFSVTINSKKLDTVEAVERINTKRTLFEVLNEYKYQNIQCKVADGKVVGINRIVTMKIKDIK